MVGMQMGQEDVCDIGGIDLDVRFFSGLNLHGRELGVDGVGESGSGLVKPRGVPCVKQNGAVLRMNQLCPSCVKLNVLSWRTFHGVVGLGPTQARISNVQFDLGHGLGEVCHWRNS